MKELLKKLKSMFNRPQVKRFQMKRTKAGISIKRTVVKSKPVNTLHKPRKLKAMRAMRRAR